MNRGDRIAFETPVDRDDELRGSPGVVRMLDLAVRSCVAIDGEGPAGAEAFTPRMPGLYATAWTLRFTLKRRGVLTKVGPLEGLWWVTNGVTDLDAILDGARESWRWTLFICLPAEAAADELAAALEAGRAKLREPFASSLRIEALEEGRVAQLLHVGPYADERPSIRRLHAAVTDAGLELHGRHHEIYLGDPSRTAPERLRTILRHAVREPR